MRGKKVLKNWLPHQGILTYLEEFISEPEATQYFEALLDGIDWRQEKVTIFGRSIDQPRLVAWHGDPGSSYSYSGLKLEPKTWSPLLMDLKSQVELATNCSFNSVLLNLYRNERDSNGWHSDNEKELGRHPKIASLSFGESRDFLVKHRQEKNQKLKLILKSGSLLFMAGEMQKHWLHCLPKRTRPLGPRINLTFRYIESKALLKVSEGRMA